MPQEICALLRTEVRQEGANCSVNLRNGSRFSRAQELLEFAVSQFDRVEVRGIFRQVPKRRSSLFDQLANARTGMGSAIVDNDDVTALEGSRTMLVVTAVSSRNTSLAGSSSPCSRIQH